MFLDPRGAGWVRAGYGCLRELLLNDSNAGCKCPKSGDKSYTGFIRIVAKDLRCSVHINVR